VPTNMGTRCMNSTQQQFIEVLDAFKVHPVITFVTGISTMVIMNLTGNIYTVHIPDILMQIGQGIAWTFVGISGMITLIGFLEKFFEIKITYKSVLSWMKRKNRKHGK
jgi:hypothetical protein